MGGWSSARRCRAALVGTLLVGAAVVATAGSVHAVPCQDIFDVNADGRADLPLGTPQEDVGGTVDGGAVTVLLGGPNGTYTGVGSRQIVQSQVGQQSERGDRFGAAVAVVDWNRSVDSCPDLAIGIPGEDGGRGRVVVVMGSANGLDLSRRVVLRQGANGTPDTPEAGDRFGEAMVASGTSAAGTAQALVVGVPGEDVGTVVDAGVVHVFSFTSGTISSSGRLVRQGAGGVPDSPERGDQFGSALAAGGSGFFKNLVVGVPGEDIGGVADAGMVHEFDGAVENHDFVLHQNSARVPDSNEAGDRFGSAIGFAHSCFSPMFFPAVVVGAPGEDLLGRADVGAVTVLEVENPFDVGNQLRQGAAGIPGAAEVGDRFGAAMTTLEAEVAIGVPGQRVGTAGGAGSVTLVGFRCEGPAFEGDIVVETARQFTQNSAGVPDTAEAGDGLGSRVSVAPTGVDSIGAQVSGALVTSAAGEAVGTRSTAGLVHTMPIGPASTVLVGNGQAFTQDSNGVPDTAEAGDRFASGIR